MANCLSWQVLTDRLRTIRQGVVAFRLGDGRGPAGTRRRGRAMTCGGRLIPMVAARILAFLGGFVLVLLPLRSAVRTFVLPRGVNDSLTRMVVLSVMRLFLLVASPKRTFAFRDRVMALFAPVALLCLPVVWVVVVTCGYVGMFWAAEAGDAA